MSVGGAALRCRNAKTLCLATGKLADQPHRSSLRSKQRLRSSILLLSEQPGTPENGDIAPWPYKRGRTEAEVPFHNSIIDNIMAYQDRIETNLLQLFVHLENSKSFSIIHVNIFEVNIVADQKQASLVTIFFVSFPCPQLFYCPLPYRCSGFPVNERWRMVVIGTGYTLFVT